MRVLLRAAIVAASCLLVCANAVGAEIDIAPYIKKAEFEDIKISPTGEYYAATVPIEDRTGLVILNRSGLKIMGGFSTGKNTHVVGFWWVNPTRILISTAQKFGALDQPQLNGNLYAIDADGGSAEILVGQGVDVMTTGSHIETKTNEKIAAFLVDDLPSDPNNVVISASTFGNDPSSRAEMMDVRTGKRRQITRSPVRNSQFVTDNAGVVRFVVGIAEDNASKLFYRAGNDAPWELINDEAATHRNDLPLGFSADDKTAYLQVEHDQGPDSIDALDIASKTRKQVLRDDDSDPENIIYRHDSSTPVGVRFMDGKPRTAFFDQGAPEARLYRSLEAAFPDGSPFITSTTADGKLALVRVSSGRAPAQYYIFDNEKKQAAYLLATRSWIDPQKTAERRPIRLAARDGRALTGYLTVSTGASAKQMPMVVLPHGGPFGIYDSWNYEDESQLLAAAGYAVLQVNYRGSGGRGREFRNAGAQQWGGAMQDDLADATRWAIEQGIADPGRVCIYGGSYGGYAALMGVAKDPALYNCAAGYVGVYDLPKRVKDLGTEGKRYVRFSTDWMGDPDKLAAASPNRIADRIKVPVFLAAGGKDEIAPIEHSKMMEKALRAANVPVETLYFPTEGHGFYTEAHRTEFYTRLLAFLNHSIGGATAAPAAAKK